MAIVAAVVEEMPAAPATFRERASDEAFVRRSLVAAVSAYEPRRGAPPEDSLSGRGFANASRMGVLMSLA